HITVRRALDEAADLRNRAQGELDRYRQRIGRIDAEVSDLLATVRKEAEAERARIIAAAEAQAEALKRDADAQIQAETAHARAALQREVSQRALDAAEALLKGPDGVKDADQRRLMDDSLARLDGLGSARTPAPGSSATPGRGPGPGRLP